MATGWGPRLLASELQMSHATVSRCLQRRGLSRRPPQPREEVRRFEWPCPGDLLQMDTKRFARFTSPGHAVTGDRSRTGAQKRQRVGYEIAHSIIDDHSRLVFTELHPDEKADTVTAFVARALQFFAGHGMTPKRLQTDNAWTYIHNQSLKALLAEHGIQHRRIPPRTPNATGKSRRYQQTSNENGAWGSATDQATPEQPPFPSGSITTTLHATTAPSATAHRSPAFGTTQGTTARAWRRRPGTSRA